MKCAITQPTYFPWAGYFNLINQVDFFVFLDDAQYQKSSWQNRNKLINNKTATWLTIPVVRDFLGQSICNVRIDDQKPWRRKHENMITLNYGRHPYFQELLSFIDIIKNTEIQYLAALNIEIIKTISQYLEIKTNFVSSSELSIQGKRTSRLIEICKHLECDTYVSPEGAQTYLEEDRFEEMTEIRLLINQFNAKHYEQKNLENFVSHLSIIDVIANLGKTKTCSYVRGEVIITEESSC